MIQKLKEFKISTRVPGAGNPDRKNHGF